MTALDRAQKLAELESIHEQTVGRPLARERLAELLGDDDPEIRAPAASAVGIYPEDAGLIEAVLRLAAEEADAAVKRAAVESLGRVLQEGVLAGAEEEGYAPETDLGEPTGELYRRTKELLQQLLRDAADDRPLRTAAATALSPLSDDPQVIDAVEGLRKADLPAALACMARSGDPRWKQAIQEALEADDQDVLTAAIHAAGRVEAVDAVPLLSRILKGSRQPSALRVAAATALGALGGKNTAAALLEVAEDEADEAVQTAARLALADLTLLGNHEGETTE